MAVIFDCSFLGLVQAEGADDLEIPPVDDGDVVAKVVVQGDEVAAIEDVFPVPDEVL